MKKTGISWTDITWNITRGCRRTSAKGAKKSGCGDASGGGCYAERQAARFCGKGQAYEGLVKLTAKGPRWTGDTRFVVELLLRPLSWRKPMRVFVDSMSDLFYDGFTDEQIAMVFAAMGMAHWHTFQVLTKRMARARALLTSDAFYQKVLAAAARLRADMGQKRWKTYPENHKHPSGIDWPLPNVWIGTSVEHQEAADERMPDLVATPAALRFVSAEPLLGPVDLTPWLGEGGRPVEDSPAPTPTLRSKGRPRPAKSNLAAGDVAEPQPRHGVINRAAGPPSPLSWVITGCESGPRSRLTDVAWLRDLRDQCARADVPLFLKQAVATPGQLAAGCVATWVVGADTGSRHKRGGLIEQAYLDGRQHAAFPEVN